MPNVPAYDKSPALVARRVLLFPAPPTPSQKPRSNGVFLYPAGGLAAGPPPLLCLPLFGGGQNRSAGRWQIIRRL
jgi:hypothetical protein